MSLDYNSIRKILSKLNMKEKLALLKDPSIQELLGKPSQKTIAKMKIENTIASSKQKGARTLLKKNNYIQSLTSNQLIALAKIAYPTQFKYLNNYSGMNKSFIKSRINTKLKLEQYKLEKQLNEIKGLLNKLS